MLKPIPTMLGSTANTREKSYPLLSPLANVKAYLMMWLVSLCRKTKESITLKLPETNTSKTRSLSHLNCDSNFTPSLPTASGAFVADKQLHEFSQWEIQNRVITAEGVSAHSFLAYFLKGSFATDETSTQNDKLKQEIEQLKKVNAQWKTLNNEMLASTLKNFEL